MARLREHRTAIRRTAVGLGAAVSLTAAFVLGVVAGAGSTPDHDSAPTTSVNPLPSTGGIIRQRLGR